MVNNFVFISYLCERGLPAVEHLSTSNSMGRCNLQQKFMEGES